VSVFTGNLTLRLIIYFNSRRDVVYAHRWCRASLLEYGFSLEQVDSSLDAMHALVSSSKKQQVVLRFMAFVIAVLATNAFGMGVNNPGVFCVVFWGKPRTLEELLQMWGRAGRRLDQIAFGLIFFATTQGTLHGIKPTQIGAARPAHMSLRLGLMCFLAYGGCLLWKVQMLMGSSCSAEPSLPRCSTKTAGCCNCDGRSEFLHFPCDVDEAISMALCIVTNIRSGSLEKITGLLVASRPSSRTTGFFPEMGCGMGILSRPDWRLLVLCMVGAGLLQPCVIDAAQSWPPVLESSPQGRVFFLQHPFAAVPIFSAQTAKKQKLDKPIKGAKPASLHGFWKPTRLQTPVVLHFLREGKIPIGGFQIAAVAHQQRPVRAHKASSDKKAAARWLDISMTKITSLLNTLKASNNLRYAFNYVPRSVLLQVLTSLEDLTLEKILVWPALFSPWMLQLEQKELVSKISLAILTARKERPGALDELSLSAYTELSRVQALSVLPPATAEALSVDSDTQRVRVIEVLLRHVIAKADLVKLQSWYAGLKSEADPPADEMSTKQLRTWLVVFILKEETCPTCGDLTFNYNFVQCGSECVAFAHIGCKGDEVPPTERVSADFEPGFADWSCPLHRV